VNHTGKKLKDYKIMERLGKASCNSAVYAAEIHDNTVAVIMNVSSNIHLLNFKNVIMMS
jgi:hypothetical protein